MQITSFEFLLFVILCLIGYYIFPRKTQWCWLLTASLFFFWQCSQWLLMYMLATTAIVYTAGLLIQKSQDEFSIKKKDTPKSERKKLKEHYKAIWGGILAVAIVLNVGILAVCKYYNFFGGIVNGISGSTLIPFRTLLMPIGISYYTLMAISYVVDVKREVVQAEKIP